MIDSINTNMKKCLFLFLCFFVFGCNVGNYDSSEYTKVVNIIFSISKPDDFCNQKSLKSNIQKLYDDNHWVVIYESGQPDNDDISKMVLGIEDEISRFHDLVNNETTDTTSYCKLKLQSLLSTLNLVLAAEGNKPR
jgi:hypothetical protein